MRYSKQLHTARFIKQLDSAIAQQKCPEFRKFFACLTRLTQKAKS
jgi:flagellar biosynthesis chaperone FliJ